ncbi:XdhC family protein [Thermodesulfobacteriota bacterium]
MDIFEEILAAKKSGRAIVLATVIESAGSAPREAGARMIINQDGSTLGTVGGGAIEKLVAEEALQMMSSAESKIIRHTLKDIGMACGGEMSIFLEPLNPASQLLIFGAGHIGNVLARIGKLLDFHVTVIDDRPEFASLEKLPFADTVIAKPYLEALGEFIFTPRTYIVIVTYKHAHDFAVLENCLQKPCRYLGMIGSKKKVAACLTQLREHGIGEDRIATIHAPIGIDIAANTPAEIAISIAAELVAKRNSDGTAAFGCCPSSA